jgi:hypothetical protein
MTWPEWKRERLIGFFVSISSTSLAHSPNRHSNIIQGFQKLQIASAACRISERFRLLELPLPEIRPEFDRNTSNAGMLQSGTSRLARCQKFHRLSMRRNRVLSRQSVGLKPKNPGQTHQAYCG